MALLGGAAAWPLAVRAQPAKPLRVPALGYLSSGPAGARQESTGAFLRALQDAGYIDGQSMAIEYRWADDQYDRLPILAADLVSRHVDVIAATGGPVTALADPFFSSQRTHIIGLAARYRCPAIYQWREFPAAGGLASYGPSLFDSYRQAGLFAAPILKGESRPTCRYSNRPSSSWSSICEPRRHWGW